jgi:hypothetical protein
VSDLAGQARPSTTDVEEALACAHTGARVRLARAWLARAVEPAGPVRLSTVHVTGTVGHWRAEAARHAVPEIFTEVDLGPSIRSSGSTEVVDRAPSEHRRRPTPVPNPISQHDQRTPRRPGFRHRAPFEHRSVHSRHANDLVCRISAGHSLVVSAPPGTRTPNPRIKRPKFTPSRYDYLRLYESARAAR